MVIVDQAPSLKVYDFKEEAVLCDIPLGNLETIIYSLIQGTNDPSQISRSDDFSIKVRIEIRI